jgi:hypothetical protein
MSSWRRIAGFVAITLIALVIAHNLVFLLAYGTGSDEALAHSGHGGAWRAAVAVTMAAACGLFGLGTWRLHHLGVTARALHADEGGLRPAPTGFVRRLVALSMSLAGSTALLFIVQENLEHWRLGEVPPGLTVLGSAEYPNAALVIAGVALAVAFVVALFQWHRDALVARIRAARGRWKGTQIGERRQSVWVERRNASIVVHQFSGRAPPSLAAI